MKDKTELYVFCHALRQQVGPGVVLSVIFVNLPNSNGAIRFCIFRHMQHHQLVAGLQDVQAALGDRQFPDITRGQLLLPEGVVHYLRHKLKKLGINHIVGIASDNATLEGTPLTCH